MKSVFIILKNVKNLLPYFLLISLYFFFINLEAKKEKDDIRNTEYKDKSSVNKSNSVERDIRITIPVIPYDQ